LKRIIPKEMMAFLQPTINKSTPHFHFLQINFCHFLSLECA
jgi:hypothetical protein